MSRILFATYEFHPTTWGGCGVLLRHATDLLLSQGHEVELLLDVPKRYFDRFVEEEHSRLSVPGRCRAHHADVLCAEFPWSRDEVENPFVWKSLRFAHAVGLLSRSAPVDFVEFFEYCGVGYHAFVEKRFGLQPERPILGTRVHNSVELIDLHEGTKPVDRERTILYGLERAALAHSEAILMPSSAYAERYYVDRYGLPPEVIEISEPPTSLFGTRPERPPEERREIQFFGRIFEFKGVERFIRAALLLLEERPDLEVDFVLIGNDSADAPGGGSYTEYLRRTVPTRLRDRFIFTGHLEHAAALERFGRARFAVFPNRFESFCYAAHEVFEAGVPMLVADIPAFRNYFDEGKTAFYFDGSSIDLARKMSRLWDSPALLETLDSGGRLAVNPLGSFYESPRALRPITSHSGDSIALLVFVIVPVVATESQVERTLRAIRPQLGDVDAIYLAYDDDDPRANLESTSIHWLGSTRRLQSVEGEAVMLSSLMTRGAAWILLAGDLPAPEFVSLCRDALSRNPSLGYAGTWARDSRGLLETQPFDIAPERYPFDLGARPTRALLRTHADRLVVEMFEAQAGIYGEIGALWSAEVEFGKGCLLARDLLQTSPIEATQTDSGQLAFLVQSVASTPRRERIALLALEGRSGAGSANTAHSQSARLERTAERAWEIDRVERVAFERLDGRSLARLAGKKLRRKAVLSISAIVRRLRSRWSR